MRQSSAKLEDLLTPSHEASDEETAIAALTALRNNNHHLHQFHHQNLLNSNSTINKNSNSSDSHDPSSNASGKSVTSLISKIHLQNLEANSVSVIPLDAKSSTSPPQIHVKNLTQLQQHLETAAVLMDIGKKVIISPPSSNPQSPSSIEHHQHHNNNHMNSNKNSKSISTSVIKVSNRQVGRMSSNGLRPSLQAQDYSIGHMKRTPSSEEMDLSIKRMKKMGGNTICTPVPSLSNMIPLIKKEVIKKEINDHDERMSPHSDSNDSDSDSGRLQMDISSQEDADEIKSLSNMNKIGRDTPESIISEEHAFDGTDAATTQLWQALAQHSGGNEATQLLRKMINCRTLGIPFNPTLHLTGNMVNDQPMALLKVTITIYIFIF